MNRNIACSPTSIPRSVPAKKRLFWAVAGLFWRGGVSSRVKFDMSVASAPARRNLPLGGKASGLPDYRYTG
ncbi:hypothetical protein [Rugamonas sp. DEMB1]|uniref:hypothetical protein n=1 Tax=Rugamonas sp. DEMB1 TaxID=3039386 RepID=UPI00244D1F07|nr:hypothetical protein [Rugamonas sp. DEMB1]WGG50486.1 hypothetical protein QC826_29470 [Rugamonas sp. DEMB1]